ncbi:MAG: pyridoxal 5'-phosphate synthase glutaminase subunit PdxT [bacterium]|nr:pyridoxal 5'-phosphate synthase glutaminase subunit PdxT [bacterium]
MTNIIGVLAIQGNFSRHSERIRELGHKTLEVRRADQLSLVSAIIIPGGESSAFLKLLDPELKNALIDAISAGMPCLATCAGIILLAKHVTNPAQESLGLIDIDVVRNAFGRQTDSFVTEDILLADGMYAMPEACSILPPNTNAIEGVFIRAPRISRLGAGVRVLASYAAEPVMVAEGNVVAMTFHPEMSNTCVLPHQLLINMANREN